MARKGNKRWKAQRSNEFDRTRRAMGYGPGFLHQSVKAKINQVIAAKFPIVTLQETEIPPWVRAQQANEAMARAEHEEWELIYGL